MISIRSILWVQHEDASKNGHLVVNGTIVSNPDDNMYYMVNLKLLKDYSLSIFDESMVKDYMNNSNNRYFQLGSGLIKGVAYRSCFLEKNRNGDIEPFMFWESSLQLKGFIKDAIKSASELGKSLDEYELKFVEKYIRKVRIRRLGCCALIATAILLTILLLTI